MSAMEDRNQKQTARSCGSDDSACSSSFCSMCGQPWPKEKKYKRIKKGTTVKHIRRGWIGQVFSYAQCEKGTCGVDFGENGKWCEAFRSLKIIETNAKHIHPEPTPQNNE